MLSCGEFHGKLSPTVGLNRQQSGMILLEAGHHTGNRPGAALLGTSSRQDETTFSRLRSGHILVERHVANLKVYSPCPNCNVTQAAPVRILACTGCHKS
ncbi:hypothetical protein TNCV_4216181 [Trichonephila clavipes]|nr:hypothetical protein TNCV_4216181 [Trichonephila clavipes]